MSRTYLVVLVAGGHTWTVTDETPPVYGLMDPLTIGWAMPDPEHRPNQPDTMVATFAVVAATAADLDDLFLGDLVTIKVTFGPVDKPEPDIAFYGRVAQGEASPDPRGMLYRFTCADLTADLAGYDIGADPYDVQPAASRMAAMLAAAGLPDSDVVRDPVVAAINPELYVEAVDKPGAGSLLTAVIALWDGIGLAGTTVELKEVNHRAIVAPHPDPAASGLPYRWALDVIPDKYVPSAGAPLPATFGPWFPAPDAYGLYIDPDDRKAGVIDACVVEFASDWAALQPAIADRAAVTWLTAPTFGLDPDGKPYDRLQQVTYTTETLAAANRVPVTTTRETQVIAYEDPDAPTYVAAEQNASRVGAMMIPAPQNPGGWAPDGFRWLLYADPAGMAAFPIIFPKHDASEKPTPRVLRTACYVRPIVVSGIPGQWNPADATREWVGGQMNSVTLTIQDGRPVIDFELAPTLPEPGNPSTGTDSWNTQAGTWNAQAGVWDDKVPGRVSFRWSDAALAGVTWNQLHPQSWDMYRLARGT